MRLAGLLLPATPQSVPARRPQVLQRELLSLDFSESGLEFNY